MDIWYIMRLPRQTNLSPEPSHAFTHLMHFSPTAIQHGHKEASEGSSQLIILF